jgi:hypothetical protein
VIPSLEGVGWPELELELWTNERKVVVRVWVMQGMDGMEPRWPKQPKPEPKWPKQGFP